MDVEAEILDLKRRVGELEGSFEFLTKQVRAVHQDLLAFQKETKQEIAQVRSEVGQVRNEVRELRRDMPGIVGDVMREVMREQQ